MTDAHRWVWEKTDPDRSGSSGDIAKLFKNEPVKVPGAFARSAPSDHATLMAREVIQNAVDAASELQRELGDDSPYFEIDFEFSSLEGTLKAEFVAALDLDSVAARASNPPGAAWRAGLGLDASGLLDRIDEPTPLNLLQIREWGTTGMYGPFEGAKSKMYLALIALGYTAKLEGSGGSYGYGKAGLIRGSGIRMVIAYSAFVERDDDPGVTRRLLGMTYWGQHELDGESFTGFARFGDLQPDGAVHPFENEEADRVAAELGMAVRDPFDVEQLGTTFVLIDPTVTADDLEAAISRNWWPAIEDRQLTITVGGEGRTMVPRPMKDPLLRTFVDAYHLAVTNQDASRAERYRQVFKRTTVGDRELTLGNLGLMAEPDGWSYEVDSTEDGGEHRSLVALVRGPRMVVEYLDVGRARPFVRGVFVAHPDVDDLLRQTEPKSHDSWQTTIAETGTDPVAIEVARIVQSRIRNHVGRFRDRLKPVTRPAEVVRLSELESLFGRFVGARGVAAGRSAESARQVKIDVTSHLEPVGSDMIRLVGEMSLGLAGDTELQLGLAEVLLVYAVVEVGGLGERVPMRVVIPEDFDWRDGEFTRLRGPVTADRSVFTFESDPYPADWTGRLKAEASLVVDRESV